MFLSLSLVNLSLNVMVLLTRFSRCALSLMAMAGRFFEVAIGTVAGLSGLCIWYWVIDPSIRSAQTETLPDSWIQIAIWAVTHSLLWFGTFLALRPPKIFDLQAAIQQYQ